MLVVLIFTLAFDFWRYLLFELVKSYIVDIHSNGQILWLNFSNPSTSQLCRKNHIKWVLRVWELVGFVGLHTLVCTSLYVVCIEFNTVLINYYRIHIEDIGIDFARETRLTLWLAML